MSANIYWQPLQLEKHDVETMTPSSTIECLESVFGPLPIKLDSGDLQVLIGMRAGGVQGISDIITALESHRNIAVWSEA